MTNDDFETLGLLVDRLDNAATAALMPIPDRIHKECLQSTIEEVRDELRSFLIGLGFNPWSTHP